MLPLQEKTVITGKGFAFHRFGAWQYPTAVIRKTFPAGYEQVMHYHDFVQVWYCHDGRYFHQVGESVYDCGPGSLFVVTPGVCHGFWIPEGCSADLFCVEVKYNLFLDVPVDRHLNAVANLFLPCFSRELGHSFPEEYRLSQQSREQAAAFLSDLSVLDYASDHMDIALIHQQLEGLFSLPEMAIPTNRRRKALHLAEQKVQPIIRAMDYMNTHYATKIVAEDLLWITALCHTDFYKCFRRFMGLTFSDYLLQLRIARVNVLLSSTTYSFSRIAELCGFADAAHLSKSYKKQTGRLLKDSRATANPEHKLRQVKPN